jgi:ATP-dependent exoDNAse (exonuclease V) beta subunit
MRLEGWLRPPVDLPQRGGGAVSFDFTPEQQQAIDRREGPLLLAANAGSGKTSVLVERYVAMVMQDDIAPGAILAVTFTDRAAGEMRARIRKLLIERGGREFVAESESAWISTLHGFCTRVLRQHAVAVGIDPTFRLLDEGESRDLRERAFERALRGFMDGGEGHVELVAAFTADLLAGEITGLYDLLRTRGERSPSLPARPRIPAADIGPVRAAAGPAAEYLADAGDLKTVVAARSTIECTHDLLTGDDPDLDRLCECAIKGTAKALKEAPVVMFNEALKRYVQDRRNQLGDEALTQLDGLLQAFSEHYEKAKRVAGAVDYSDLELLTRDLLVSNEGLRESYRGRFERVMVDEFQDINPLQLELLELLDNGHTFVVGDEFQSIYGFRHADVEVFRGRRAELAKSDSALVLPDNFRSHPDLLNALNVVFSERFGDGFEPLSRGQTDNARESPRLEVLVTEQEWDADDDDDERDLKWRGPEARLIASRVAALLESKEFRARDIAVLVRAASDMHIYERALELRDIPTLASGGRGFWARRQIRDLLAYLASLANPRDEVEFFALLASPLAGISSTGLVQIADAAAPGYRWEGIARDDEELAKVLSPTDREALDAFRAWFEPLRRHAPQMSLSDLLDHAITGLGYDVHVLALPAGRRRLVNLFKLQRLATQFEAVHGRDIRGFVDRAQAELEADAREPEAPIELGDADAVQLMTMHAAKGLEFPVVVCADLGRQPMSRRGRVLVDGDRIGLRLPSLRGEPHNTLDFAELNEEYKQRDMAEEHRVLYVALTRAEELLIVSGGEKLSDWKPASGNCPPIRWLAPGLVPDLATHIEGEPVADVVGHAGGAIRLSVLTPQRAEEMLAIEGEDPQVALKIHTAPAPPPAVPVEPPRLPAPGVPDRLSYTSVSSYGKCGYQHYLRRVLRMPEVDPGELATQDAPPSGLDPRIRGSIVHELLEGLDFAEPKLPPEEEIRKLAEIMETEIDQVGVNECLALVSAFIDGPIAPRLRESTRVQRERGFAFALDVPGAAAPLVNGFVDVIAHQPDGSAVILDYKTDQVEDGTDLEKAVAADYGVQRAIYALAALRGGANAVEVTHLFLNRPEDPATAKFTTDDIPALEAQVREQAAGLLAGDFTPTDTPHRGLCATCPGRSALCSYGPEMTERELPS